MVLPSDDEPTRVVEPGKEAFDLPATTVAAERSAVLGAAPARAIWRNHLDAVVVTQLRVQEIAVVAAVADQALERQPLQQGPGLPAVGGLPWRQQEAQGTAETVDQGVGLGRQTTA